MCVYGSAAVISLFLRDYFMSVHSLCAMACLYLIARVLLIKSIDSYVLPFACFFKSVSLMQISCIRGDECARLHNCNRKTMQQLKQRNANFVVSYFCGTVVVKSLYIISK